MINQDASDKADIETIFNDHENINTVTMFVFLSSRGRVLNNWEGNGGTLDKQSKLKNEWKHNNTEYLIASVEQWNKIFDDYIIYCTSLQYDRSKLAYYTFM
jgi:hypothetical protein